jgi:hypothetical protein
MKKIYFAFIPALLLLLSACKKDKSDSYDELLARGNWELSDFSAPNYPDPGFVDGFFTFSPGGHCEYKDKNGNMYYGTWDHTWHNDLETHSLYIEVTDPVTKESKFDFFDDIQFSSGYKFNAYIYVTTEPCVFNFRLQH